MSLGTDRVRVDFNPSDDTEVNVIKMGCAGLIDDMEDIKSRLLDQLRTHESTAEGAPEIMRLIALGHTAIEQASMWYVKAITAGK